MNDSHEPSRYPTLDAHLHQLAIAAQGHPPQSWQRQRALSQLIRALQTSKKLVRPRRDQFQGLYEEIYADALQRLFTHICERIDAYDPQRGAVLQWANYLLNRQFFIEASREFLPTFYSGADTRPLTRLTLEDLDRTLPSEASGSSPADQLLQCLQDDPDGLFRQTHIDQHPAANFQFLAMQRLAGYSWQELSLDLGVQISTLSSFYQRCLNKFKPQFRAYLS